MPDAIYTLSPTQRAQLRALWDCGAATSGTAREPLMVPGFHLTLAALLVRMDLIAVYAPLKGRSRYFLTPAGAAEVRKPSEARRG